MGKSAMDDFNDTESTSDNKQLEIKPSDQVSWEEIPGSEAVCAVCDALFTPVIDRPPILCPVCKEALAYTVKHRN